MIEKEGITGKSTKKASQAIQKAQAKQAVTGSRLSRFKIYFEAI